MPLSLQQKEIIIEATKDWVKRASSLYQKTLPEIEIRLDLRGRTSGMFCYRGRQCFIRYNSAIFERYFDENVSQTIPHEVAHYVVHKLYRKRTKPHGPEWKQVMADFGVPADVTSKLDVKDLSTRTLMRYPYYCDCSEHQLTSIRHNRIQRGTRGYGCPKCKQPLVHRAHC